MEQQVQIGAELPSIAKAPNEVSLFLFSAATWNSHRIHYDREYAHAEGHKDIVVHGSLRANWLVEAMLSWAPGALLRSFSFRNVAPAFVGESFTAGGHVTDVRPGTGAVDVTIDLRVEGPSGITTVGRGVLRFPGTADGTVPEGLDP